MDLTNEQKQTVAEWVNEGDGLADLQQRIRDEFGVAATYMDVRFLVIDLGLTLKEEERQERPPVESAAGPAEPAAQSDQPAAGGLSGADGKPLGGGVSVELDRVMQAGAVVSGSVTFSDGVTATWSLDQLGRLALKSSQEGYQPSQEDIEAFQLELRDAIQKRGI